MPVFNTAQTQQVFNRLFAGMSVGEIAKQFGYSGTVERGNELFVDDRIGVQVTEDNRSGDAQVRIGVSGYFIGFTISPYPACCGIRLMHHFSVPHNLSQEVFDKLMNVFINENKSTVNVYEPLGRCNRVEIVMVEPGSRGQYMTPNMNIPPVDDPNLKYKQFWNFFQKHATKVQDRLQYNSNSYNILHVLEVVF